MNRWLIKDHKVIEALRENGYIVDQQVRPGPGVHIDRLGNIAITTQPAGKTNWCDTNAPITFNGSLTLSDGRVIRSSGTVLKLVV